MTLCATDICVRFDDKTIVESASLTIAPGEFVCLLGPNGAGKTTLVRAICQLAEHNGKVSWLDRSLDALDARERARTIAYVPQGHAAHWPLSVRRLVAIGRFPHASSLTKLSQEDERAIDRALAATDAQEFAHRDVTTLSGGERARVMLSRALAVEAPVLLADEPVAALDPAHQLAIAELLRELTHQGKAILAVLHDLSLASRYADRVVVMDRGKVIADGTPTDALTPDRLARVFHIETRTIEIDGKQTLVPWHTT